MDDFALERLSSIDISMITRRIVAVTKTFAIRCVIQNQYIDTLCAFRHFFRTFLNTSHEYMNTVVTLLKDGRSLTTGIVSIPNATQPKFSGSEHLLMYMRSL